MRFYSSDNRPEYVCQNRWDTNATMLNCRQTWTVYVMQKLFVTLCATVDTTTDVSWIERKRLRESSVISSNINGKRIFDRVYKLDRVV